MYDADYWRDQATNFRRSADLPENMAARDELLELAAVAQEVAEKIEDRIPGG